MPIINPGYTYLTKYNLGILVNSISYNIYFSSINSELIDLIDFNRQLFLEIPSNSFLYFTIKLEEEEENNYQLNINNSPSSNFITIYK
ncbi:hypothetical protein RZS08_06015 [Arthrospira platensis SPKY1]|nr:hypothetical protein [Arthrospira platensis SPKY1]